MSDPTLSDIGSKKRLALLWTIIFLAFLRSWSNSFIEYCLDKNYTEKLETFKKLYSDLCCQALRRYVFSKGAHLAELLTRSIYARDWLGCSEPRGPRPIVKNIIDEIRNLDEKNSRKFFQVKENQRLYPVLKKYKKLFTRWN